MFISDDKESLDKVLYRFLNRYAAENYSSLDEGGAGLDNNESLEQKSKDSRDQQNSDKRNHRGKLTCDCTGQS